MNEETTPTREEWTKDQWANKAEEYGLTKSGNKDEIRARVEEYEEDFLDEEEATVEEEGAVEEEAMAGPGPPPDQEDLGSGFRLVESREGYHEARNDAYGVNISAVDRERLQTRVDSYGRDHAPAEAEPEVEAAVEPEADESQPADTTVPA